MRVSYTWGDHLHTREVRINGKPHVIRENLWKFLHILREKGQFAPLWVDAISINQVDLVEKGHQVSIAGQIFSAAVMTRVWLGEAADDSNRYMEAIAGPGLLSCPDENKFLGRPRIILLGESACYNPSAAERNYMQEHPNYKSWHAMVVRPYWSGTWIVQEILLSGNLEIHCGNRKLPWDVFWGFRSSIPNNHLQYNSQVVGGSSAEHLSRERSKQTRPRQPHDGLRS